MTAPNPVGYCTDCDQPMYSRHAPAGYLRHNGHGLCHVCKKQRARDDELAMAQALLPGRADTEWMTEAACAQIGPADDYFYPPKGVNAEPAKNVCRTICPVREECLRYAMTFEKHSTDRYGVFGGLSPRERDALARNSKEDAA